MKAFCTLSVVLAASLLSGAPVNVLSLGVKNDGSADVSAIVNAATQTNALFFPAGRYRVEHPLVLKNRIHGEGYARLPKVNDERTWFVSALGATNAATAVISFGGKVEVNVEEINILCQGPESAIRIDPCEQNTSTFISHVGIFNLSGTAIASVGWGSRPIFFEDITVFGKKHAEGSVGIDLDGPVDCRLADIEIMGTQIGLRICNGHTYGSNLHLWTGCMGGTDNGTWWKGTRGITLGPNGRFTGSQIYPDTSFYAIEQLGNGGQCEISNVMYWEDESIKVAPDHDGRFYYREPGSDGRLILSTGLVGVGGTDEQPGWMAKMYNPDIIAHDVAIKSRYAICGKNLDRLCLGGALPDYTVAYTNAGWCKVADVFTNAPTGSCSAELSLDDGAAWKLSLVKGADGKVEFSVKTENALCGSRTVRRVDEDGLVKLFLSNPSGKPFKARFVTRRMNDRFRPLDHGALLDYNGRARYRDVRATPTEAYPVLCWTYHAFTNRLDDARIVADWKALGINRPLSPRVDGTTDKVAFRAFLDRCLAAGIRPYVYDTRIADVGNIRTLVRERNDGGATYRALVRQVVADWGDHPAVAGFYVGDEPDAPDASATFLAARIQREEAPKLEPLLNLLPWFDWIGPRIGAKSLGEYLDRCRRESGLDFLGYDCYAQQKGARTDKDLDDYFHNLREWAEFGRRSGVRWNTTLLCTPHYSYVVESADDFRWQISTAAAMGAKGLSWFYPDIHAGAHDNYRDAPVNALGERTATFDRMGTQMRLFQRQFGAALMGLTWDSAICFGRAFGGIPLIASGTNGLVRTVASRDGALVSCFRDAEGRPYAALVALSRTASDRLTVTFAAETKPEILGWNGRWKPLATTFDPLDREKRGPQTVSLHAAPGQLFLVRASSARTSATR